jgi:hypothetical protein
MHNFFRRQFSGGLMLSVISFANAQSPTPTVGQSMPPDSLAFKSYRPFTVEPITPWPTANKTVEQIGGWRAYAREASELPMVEAPTSDPKEAMTKSPSAQTPASTTHHKGHKP